MAEKRMFAKTIIDSDLFLDMPVTAQLLYFHLCMRADDDGFINNPKRIMRDVRCSDDDMKMLIAKDYVIPFESGVIVIKHWRLHNYIQKDRYKPTLCDEKNLLTTNKNKVYERMDTGCIQIDNKMDTECVQIGDTDKIRLDKNRLDKSRLDSSVSADTPTTPPKKPKKKFVPPSYEEVKAYIDEKRLNVDAQKFFDYYEAGDWHDGNGKAVKSWKQKCLTWDKHDTGGHSYKDGFKAERKGNGQEFSKDPRRSERQTARETARNLRVHGSDWSTGDSGGW